MKQKPIENPDTANEDPQYWEQVLYSHGLSMKRGHQPKLTLPIGNLKNLEIREKREFEESTGRVMAKGHSSDKD